MSNFTRELKRYMVGDDVRAVKEKLLEIGYLEKCTHSKFGNDTYRAVRAYQADNDLDITGVVDYDTWGKLIGHEPVPDFPMPDHLSDEIVAKLKPELASVSEVRRELCLLALNYATEAEHADYPRGFYIRGANLYDKDLLLHLMTPRRLEQYFAKKSYEQYYDNSRKEMMLRYAEEHNYDIPGADCSGMIVGLWRARKISSAGFDASANALYRNYCVHTDEPKPGDLAWKDGHIGLYVGASYAVESAGGAYGIQLTTCSKRRLFNFVSEKIQVLKGWSAFGDPKWY